MLITANCCKQFHKKTAACWCVWQRRVLQTICKEREIYCWYGIITNNNIKLILLL